MTRTRSILGRILLGAAGVLVALIAVLLIGRGLRALRGAPATAAAGEVEVATATGSTGGEEAADEARWQWFAGATRPGADAEPPARDLRRLPGLSDSPFDRAYARFELARLGLALEGVGRGYEPMALVSGRVLRIGDRIAGYELVSIDRTGVTLVNANGTLLDLTPQDPATRRRSAVSASATSSGGGAALGSGTAAGSSEARFQPTQVPGADGLLGRIYRPDGSLDLAATHPGPIVMEREKAKSLPYDRFKPWPEGPFPPAPSSFAEREHRNSARPNLPPQKRGSGG